ncbi:SUMF1/EgtB/PvdO family nonheme iron enzyme [Sorangium sp. So ce131]|uniref:SUMF1/EgtB/PvdO family nonheme iron enzyme n=1 Tax=Sorangium sp. So ce131 TaxID=3133282 RepID=UPI003F642A9D
MPNESPLCVDLHVDRHGDVVSIKPSLGDGRYGQSHDLARSVQGLRELEANVGRAAHNHRPLDAQTAHEAHALHDDVFRVTVTNLVAEARLRAKGRPVLLRLVIDDPALKAVPWEVMCAPGSQEGFLAVSTEVRPVRAVLGGEDVEGPLETDRIRILMLAATGGGVVETVHRSLRGAISRGQVEWLDPIIGDQLSAERLRASLQQHGEPDRSPHVVHIVGHGTISQVDRKPSLELPGDGMPVIISIEGLAQDLKELYPTLRLVVLDSCRSASPGATGSAAEILARQATCAVIAHLWKVRADVAAAGAGSLYAALTSPGPTWGDVAASLHGARRDLLRGTTDLEGGAGAFSPVLYLRGNTPALFRPTEKPPPQPKPSPWPGLALRVLLMVGAMAGLMAGVALLLRQRVEARVCAARRVETAQQPVAPDGMVYLRGGTFRIGSTPEEVANARTLCEDAGVPKSKCDELMKRESAAARDVEVSPFFLDRAEVRRADFAAWLERLNPAERAAYLVPDQLAGIYEDQRRFLLEEGHENHPVVGVTWRGAQAYCRARDGRLPTAAEWEFAARGTERALYPWGSQRPSCAQAAFGRRQGLPCFRKETAGGAMIPPTDPVDQGSDRRPETGILHLSGNVAEWVADAAGESSPEDCLPVSALARVLGCSEVCRDPVKKSASTATRVLRGGDWAAYGFETRGAMRSYQIETAANTNIGFRCAADVPSTPAPTMQNQGDQR